MKFVLPNAKLGDRIRATVVEQIDRRQLIASFHGDLLRINNQTGHDFAVGQEVELVVTGVKPLQFRLNVTPRMRGIDISV